MSIWEEQRRVQKLMSQGLKACSFGWGQTLDHQTNEIFVKT